MDKGPRVQANDTTKAVDGWACCNKISFMMPWFVFDAVVRVRTKHLLALPLGWYRAGFCMEATGIAMRPRLN